MAPRHGYSLKALAFLLHSPTCPLLGKNISLLKLSPTPRQSPLWSKPSVVSQTLAEGRMHVPRGTPHSERNTCLQPWQPCLVSHAVVRKEQGWQTGLQLCQGAGAVRLGQCSGLWSGLLSLFWPGGGVPLWPKGCLSYFRNAREWQVGIRMRRCHLKGGKKAPPSIHLQELSQQRKAVLLECQLPGWRLKREHTGRIKSPNKSLRHSQDSMCHNINANIRLC